MIQRIQTVFMAVAIAFNLGYVLTPLFQKVMDDPTLWIFSTHVAGLLFATGLTAWSLALFKRRLRQLYWLKISMFFQVVVVATALGVLVTLGGFGTWLWDEALSFGLITSVIILQYLSFHYVLRDEKLVKSMDRIR